MKVVVLLTLFCYALSILDRSYYDALCRSKIMQNSLSVQAKKIFEMHSENYPRSITPIETQAQDRDSKRSMLVRKIIYSLLNALRLK